MLMTIQWFIKINNNESCNLLWDKFTMFIFNPQIFKQIYIHFNVLLFLLLNFFSLFLFHLLPVLSSEKDFPAELENRFTISNCLGISMRHKVFFFPSHSNVNDMVYWDAKYSFCCLISEINFYSPFHCEWFFKKYFNLYFLFINQFRCLIIWWKKCGFMFFELFW